MTDTFSLDITIGYGVNHHETEEQLNTACSQTFEMASSFCSSPSSHTALSTSCADVTPKKQNQDRFFVASTSHMRLSADPSDLLLKTNTHLIAVFVPPHMTAGLEKHFSSNCVASGSLFWIESPCSTKFAQDLLPKIHATALSRCRILGIILTSIAANNGPAEIVLLEVPRGTSIQKDILHATSGDVIEGDSNLNVLKILPITIVKFTDDEDDEGKENYFDRKTRRFSSRNGDSNSSDAATISSQIVPPQIPTCPVCIHRIDPIRLGLPAPCVQDLCSKFCPSPSVGSWSEEEICPKQRLLKKWSLPARCKACEVIDHYWNYSNNKRDYGEDEESRDLFCGECSMHKTLWTCLTCGFVGCGRYSNKHSVAHFEKTGHPYSLELATLRIWDYRHMEYGGFVTRADLLECPSSPPLRYPWLSRGFDLENHPNSLSIRDRPHQNTQVASICGSDAMITEKSSSKKAVMIGEEYEALLQSALEDQAQYYEGEITRLRGEYTNSLLDTDSMIPEEIREIETLKHDVSVTKEDIEKTTKELLEAQAKEAGLRAASQRLLSEQQESNELLKKIQEEHRKENEQGKIQIEDLEQQIADLSANLRMRQQFSQSNELSNAQIFGTASAPETKQSGGKRGKKKGRFFRK